MAEQEWRTTPFRQKVMAQIEEAVRAAGNPTSKSSIEMENHVFQKAKTREEYLALVARLILHVRDINSKKEAEGKARQQAAAAAAAAAAASAQDPMSALQGLTAMAQQQSRPQQPTMQQAQVPAPTQQLQKMAHQQQQQLQQQHQQQQQQQQYQQQQQQLRMAHAAQLQAQQRQQQMAPQHQQAPPRTTLRQQMQQSQQPQTMAQKPVMPQLPTPMQAVAPQQQPIGPPTQQPIGPPTQQPIGLPTQQPVGPPSQQPIGPPSQQHVGQPMPTQRMMTGQQPPNQQPPMSQGGMPASLTAVTQQRSPAPGSLQHQQQQQGIAGSLQHQQQQQGIAGSLQHQQQQGIAHPPVQQAPQPQPQHGSQPLASPANYMQPSPSQPHTVSQQMASPAGYMQPSPNQTHHISQPMPSPVSYLPQPSPGQQHHMSQQLQSPASYLQPSPSPQPPQSHGSTGSTTGGATVSTGTIPSPAPGSTASSSVRTPAAVQSPGSILNTPGNPSSVGAVPSPSQMPARSTVDEQAYIEKWKQLSKYIEPLTRMINKVSKDENRKNELNKMKNLLDILQDPNKRMPINTLLKCEQVLEKLELQIRPPSTSTAPTLPSDKPSIGKQQHMCQPLLDAILQHIKSPMLNHTLQRTFGPPMQAIHGTPISLPAPPSKRLKVSKEESSIPHVVQGEVARLNNKFKVNLDPAHHSGGKAIHLICKLDDKHLPSVPPISITLPENYPVNSPQCEPNSPEYGATSFLQSVQRTLTSQLLRMPDRYSLSQVLDAWEMSVRQACAS